jgi:hypothetical protein
MHRDLPPIRLREHPTLAKRAVVLLLWAALPLLVAWLIMSVVFAVGAYAHSVRPF